MTLRLNAPPRNLFSEAMAVALEEALDQAQADPGVRVIVLAGSGNAFFCAGADIKEFPTLAGGGLTEHLRKREALLRKIERGPKPVIAALNGPAVGGGFALALACHFRLAVEYTYLSLPEVDRGILPGWGLTRRLPLLIGHSKALEVLAFGESINAFKALELGIVHRVYSPSGFPGRVEAFANKVASKPPLVVSGVIQAMDAYATAVTEAAQACEIEIFEKIAASADAAEGVMAFMEKRPPNFTGK